MPVVFDPINGTYDYVPTGLEATTSAEAGEQVVDQAPPQPPPEATAASSGPPPPPAEAAPPPPEPPPPPADPSLGSVIDEVV